MAKLRKSSFLCHILHLTTLVSKNQVQRLRIFQRRPQSKFYKHSKLTQIPVEILILIVDYLDKADLASLIRTCRHLHLLLEGVLYREIVPFIPGSRRKHDMLIQTLVKRPDLILNIRSYHGAIFPTIVLLKSRELYKIFNTNDTMHPRHLALRAIDQTTGFKNAVFIFSNAANIVDLNLMDNRKWPSDPLLEPIAAAVSNMSLKQLTLWDCDEVLHVLRAQPELEELYLESTTVGLEELEKTDVPKLRSLSTTLREAACLVPGRPIERLKLLTGFGAPEFDGSLFERLSLSTRCINEFSVRLYQPWGEEGVRTAIRAIARKWPELKKLEINVGGEISGDTILEEIPSLRSIRCLTFLEARLATAADQTYYAAYNWTQLLHNGDIVQQTPGVEEWDDHFSRLRELCPSLVDVSYTPPRFPAGWVLSM